MVEEATNTNIVPWSPPPSSDGAEAKKRAPLIQSSAAFTCDFIPPDYLVDGILQRRFCYSLTAKTGTGKTAVLLRVSANVALGRAIGNIQSPRSLRSRSIRAVRLARSVTVKQ